jgi:nucleoside-specific outer membrane channel protein Tsx
MTLFTTMRTTLLAATTLAAASAASAQDLRPTGAIHGRDMRCSAAWIKQIASIMTIDHIDLFRIDLNHDTDHAIMTLFTTMRTTLLAATTLAAASAASAQDLQCSMDQTDRIDNDY